jgi:phage repressor protein C with HTH and peptisase S24 domain
MAAQGLEHVCHRFNRLRDRLGSGGRPLSVERFARGMGFAYGSSVERYIDPEKYGPDKQGLPGHLIRRTIDAYAGQGDPPITEDELLGLSELSQSRTAAPDAWSEPRQSGSVTGGLQESHNIVTPEMLPYRDLRDFQPLDKDVPVYGTAAGAVEGAFQMNNDGSPINTVRRPDSLIGAKNVYALYVQSDSMIPQYKPGDLIYVHPDRPALVGDSVVVLVRYADVEDIQVFLKCLVRRTDKKLVLEKHNPKGKLEIDMKYVQAIQRVMTTNELLGF